MLSKLAKLLLVATSVAPVLGAYGIISIIERDPWLYSAQWFFYAAVLLLLCALVMKFSKIHIAAQELALVSIKSADKEILAFLLTYLLPIIAKDTISLKSPLPLIYIFAIIFWAIYHSNAFFFNPLLGFLGYHFYEIDVGNNVPLMLISRRTIRTVREPITSVHLFEYTYLEIQR